MIKRTLTGMAMIAMLSLAIVSCSKDDGPARSEITLEIVGLETLTSGARYEGWLIVDGEPKSTGKFTSTSSSQTFSAVATDVENATAFELTVEPPNDSDSGPSASKLLSGTFVGNTAAVSINTSIADLTGISGRFVLATPTDDNNNPIANDEFGIWFEDPSGIQSVAGLSLPTLASGWKYEGWVMLNGTPVTTGTFSDENAADDASPYSGNATAPNYPGEDFLNSAPVGLTFPQDGDVRGNAVMVTIEPSPDYDQSTPFFLQPLTGTAGQDVSPAVNDLTANANAPFGRVLR